MRFPIVIIACCGGLLVSCVAPITPPGGKPATMPGRASTVEAPGGSDAAGGLPSGVAGSRLLATIETVRAELEPGAPARAKVTISGLLHDGATRVQSVEQRRTAQGVEISVTTSRPPHSKAGVALIPFERIVSVDLSGMKPGACRITANEASTMLMVP